MLFEEVTPDLHTREERDHHRKIALHSDWTEHVCVPLTVRPPCGVTVLPPPPRCTNPFSLQSQLRWTQRCGGLTASVECITL